MHDPRHDAEPKTGSHRLYRAILAGRYFCRARSGSIAVTYAAAAMMLITAGMGAIDLGRVTVARTELQNALDSALLAAAKGKAENASDSSQLAQASSAFSSNLLNKSVTNATLGPIQAVGSGDQVSVTGTATAKLDLSLSITTQALGSISVDGAVKITKKNNALDLIFLVDVSSSMGLGADTHDMTNMTQNIGCAFACHQTDVDRAHSFGARTRIDVARDAINASVNHIMSVKKPEHDIRFAFGTFSNTLIYTSPLTSSPQALSALADQHVKIAAYRVANQGGTDFVRSFSDMSTNLSDFNRQRPTKKTSHDGVERYVIILTDGMQDYRGTGSYNVVPLAEINWYYISPMPTGSCAPLKRNDEKVMVLNTKYAEFNEYHVNAVNTFLVPHLPGYLRSCVSDPAYVLDAGSSTAIVQAAKMLAEKAYSQFKIAISE